MTSRYAPIAEGVNLVARSCHASRTDTRPPRALASRGWDMTARKHQTLAAIFAAFTSEDVALAYARLLDAGGVPKDEASAFVGGEHIVRTLTELGMAHVSPHTPDGPATFQPARPDLALQGVLGGTLARLAADSDRLGAGYRELAELHARPDRAVAPSPLVEVTTGRREVLSWSCELINSAHRDWMTLETFATDMPVTDDYIVAPAPAVKQSVRVRSIYDRAFTQSPVGARIIGSLLADGQEARVLAELPMKMQLADESCVLLPLTPTGTGGAMLVHAHPVVSALRQFFELLWERAVPYGSVRGAPGLTGRQRAVLSLLAQGLTDEAIAKQLSCSTKTVGREAAAIAARLGATSRFAAGAAAQRRGWLSLHGTDGMVSGSGRYPRCH
jgi:DNA-binding CsgD family transcriptional regulator